MLTVEQQRVLNLLGADAVSTHVDHLVTPAVEREGAVTVAHRRVALHVASALLKVVGPSAEVPAPARFAKAVRLPHGQGLIRKMRLDHHLALLAVSGAFPAALGALLHHLASDPWQRPALGVGQQRLLRIVHAAAPDDGSVLGRPVAVDVILGQVLLRKGVHDLVDGLGAKHAKSQARQVVLGQQLLDARATHDHAKEGGARLENRRFIARDDGWDAVDGR